MCPIGWNLKLIKLITRASLLAWLAFSPLWAFANCAIPSFQADYNAEIYQFPIGVIHESLHVHPDKTYRFEAEGRSQLAVMEDLVQELSEGRVTDHGVFPNEYQFFHELTAEYEAVNFSWATNTASVFTANGDGPLLHKVFAIRPGTSDFLSQQLILRRALAKNPNLQYFDVDLIFANAEKKYHFVRVGDPIIRTPMGRMKTVEFAQKDHAEIFRLWLASGELNGVVVRAQHQKAGQVDFDLALTQYRTQPVGYCLA